MLGCLLLLSLLPLGKRNTGLHELMPLPQCSPTPSQPGLKLSRVISPENTRARGCLSCGSPPLLSYPGFQLMAHPHAQTPVGRQTSHGLPASVSSELKASFCREF